MERITTILQKYINERIPRKATNIFWQMFNGIEAMFTNLEYRLDIFKRERNMLTAQNLSSLRSLAAGNGFEPKLKVPSKGLLLLKANPKLFNRCGFPLFLTPYSIFTNKLTNLTYLYVGSKTLKIDNNTLYIPVIEGELKTIQSTATGVTIERVYLQDENIAENSIVIDSNGIQYQEVKSFFDNENVNDNKQFLVKFSSNSQFPIIVYIKGLTYNDTININYQLTSGEIGNIDGKVEFDTESIIDNLGSQIVPDDTEISIYSISGFDLGSNGTDENTLRAAIGYNHGSLLLFDNQSYRNFLSKYSTILLQNILIDNTKKSINNIYLSKKQSLNLNGSIKDLVFQYQKIVDNQLYFLTSIEKDNLNAQIEEFEFSMSSHNIYDSLVCKYAFQLKFDSSINCNLYLEDIQQILYSAFSIFLYNKNHLINIDTIFETFMTNNNIKFEYSVFNEIDEQNKINSLKYEPTSSIILHDKYLPILKGDFNICDSSFNAIKLFFDINMVSET